jgi:hypothetical protein
MRQLSFFRRSLAALLAFCLSLAALPRDGNAATEVSRSLFSKFISKDCSATASCTADFGIVPARTVYEIKSVSCYVSIENVNGRVLYWYLHSSKNGSVIGRIHLRPTFLGKTSTSITYNATEQAYLRVPQGAAIFVTMTRDGTTAGAIPGMDCTISGDAVGF